MPIPYVCLGCREEMNLPDQKAGQLCACPRCRLKFVAPAARAARAPADRPKLGPPPSGPAPRPAPKVPIVPMDSRTGDDDAPGGGLFGMGSGAPSGGLFGQAQVEMGELFGSAPSAPSAETVADDDDDDDDEGPTTPARSQPRPGAASTTPGPWPGGAGQWGHAGAYPPGAAHGGAAQGRPGGFQGPQGHAAPQGYPPQGYPPQGFGPGYPPPQGYPPQGYPGYPPQGYPGYPPQAGAPPGQPPSGPTPRPASDEGPLELADDTRAAASKARAASCRIVCIEGLPDGTEFALPPGKIYVIGRDKEADVKILSTSVSRRQAQIDATGAHPVLIDCGSANGTQVNGELVGRHPLREGDLIKMGKVVFRFQGA